MALGPSFTWQPSRREFSWLALAAPWLMGAQESRKVQNTAEGEPQFVTPPGEPSSAEAARITELGAALAAGSSSVNALLADKSVDGLRPFPSFRALIAKHAPVGRAVMITKDEPGRALLATVRVLDADGNAYAGVRVYAYHTSDKGWYAAEAPHVSGNSGDYRFARLFTHAVTDDKGCCELVTIHPVGYPHSDLPSHVHLLLEGRKDEERGTEIRFEDCPRMTAAARAESLKSGYVVAPVETLADGSLRCIAEFRLPAG